MANTIDTAFIKQFESEVHLAYQRMGSKLRNTVRMANNVTGKCCTFSEDWNWNCEYQVQKWSCDSNGTSTYNC